MPKQKMPKSERDLRQLAEAGNAEACNQLGMLLLSSAPPVPPPSVLPKLISELERKIQYFNERANDAFEWHIEEGVAFWEDSIREARRQIAELEQLPSDIAQRRAGLFEEAFLFFARSAALGDTEGMFNLAWRHWLGEGTPANCTEAIRLWRTAAERGHAGAKMQVEKLGLAIQESTSVTHSEGLLYNILMPAMTSTFDHGSLRSMVRIYLDIAPDSIMSERTVTDKVYELVAWAVRTRNVDRLLQAVLSASPLNHDLRNAVDTIRQAPGSRSGKGKRSSSPRDS